MSLWAIGGREGIGGGGCQPPHEPTASRLAGCLRQTCPTADLATLIFWLPRRACVHSFRPAVSTRSAARRLVHPRSQRPGECGYVPSFPSRPEWAEKFRPPPPRTPPDVQAPPSAFRTLLPARRAKQISCPPHERRATPHRQP